MNNELQKTEYNELTPLTKEMVKEYLAPAAEDRELTLFIELCKAQGLNPFINEAYLVVFKLANGTRKSQIITGKNVFLKRAHSHPSFDGLQAGVILQRKGEVVYQQGAFKLDDDKLIGGWADVYKKGVIRPIRQEVTMDEYSSGQSTWRAMPLTMIRKVALVHALREAFPETFHGLYDESELASFEGKTINHKPKKSIDDTKINEEQVKTLKAAIEKSPRTLEQILESLKINSLEDVAENKLASIMNRLIELTNENN